MHERTNVCVVSYTRRQLIHSSKYNRLDWWAVKVRIRIVELHTPLPMSNTHFSTHSLYTVLYVRASNMEHLKPISPTFPTFNWFLEPLSLFPSFVPESVLSHFVTIWRVHTLHVHKQLFISVCMNFQQHLSFFFPFFFSERRRITVRWKWRENKRVFLSEWWCACPMPQWSTVCVRAACSVSVSCLPLQSRERMPLTGSQDPSPTALRERWRWIGLQNRRQK